MSFTRQQYSYDHFSGSNITISIGPSVLTQCFGIEYSVSQNKVPIYGYNSQLYDGFAKGIVQVNGRLIVNFVSPRYLTVTLQRYHLVMNAFRRTIETGNLNNILMNQESFNLFSALTRHLSVPTNAFPVLNPSESLAHLGNSATPLEWQINSPAGGINETAYADQAFHSTSQEDLSTLLDEFFASDQAVRGLEQMLWGDNANFILGEAISGTNRGPERQWSINDLLEIGNGGGVNGVLGHEASFGRPDSVGSPIDGINGIDITIVYGSAYGASVTNTSFNYDHSAVKVIKGVQFTGESESIMADGNPVIDVYSFFARNVYAVNPPRIG